MYNLLGESPFQATPIELVAEAAHVEPTAIPVYTDEELLKRAEEMNDWDSLERYGYGTEETITMRALRRRFCDKYLQGKDCGEAMFVVDKFVAAMWDAKRSIPTVSEYAANLGDKGLLNAEDLTRAKALDSRSANEDEAWERKRLVSKMYFYANADPAATEGRDLKKLASEYVFKQGSNATAAKKMLLEVRGLSEDEIREAQSPALTSKYLEWRALGVPTELAQHMAENPCDALTGNYADTVDGTMRGALCSGLETQIAVRQYFGMGNFYAFLEYQSRANHVARIDSINNAIAAAAFNGALARGDESTIQSMQQGAEKRSQVEADEPKNVFELPIYSPEEKEHFEALAIRAAHEPVLRKHMAYFTENAIQSAYLQWISRTESAQS